jgi:glycine/D-amino acid oxidase-like deaminating enzyme
MTSADTRVPLPRPRSTPHGVLRGAPFKGDPVLPAASEIAIIGGGILGITTAYYLAARKIPVVLCEKAELACESSSRAFGWISELLVDAVNQPMAQEAKHLWPRLHAEVGETGYRRHGICYLADGAEELGGYRGWLDSVAGLVDSDTRILSTPEVAARFPTANRSFAGGILAPSDGSAEPILATAAIAEAARKAGARILTDCAVRGMDLKGGRVAGLFTERGYVATSIVLAATNVWTRLFCGNHGIDVPQLYAIMSMGRSTRVEGPQGAGGQMHWAFRAMVDGSYALGGVTGIRVPVTRDSVTLARKFRPLMKTLGGAKLDLGWDAWTDFRRARRWDPKITSPFEHRRVLSGTTRVEVADHSLRDNAKVFPEMGQATVQEHWSGPLVMTPDGNPILGPVDAIAGFHIATACSFGISWAPSVGKLMADLMTGRSTSIDRTPFRLSRFSDGSELKIAH